MTGDIGDLEAELAREREQHAALNKERKALELRAYIASLRAENITQEWDIRARKLELSTASEASYHQERSRISSHMSRDLGRGLQGQGRPTKTTGVDPYASGKVDDGTLEAPFSVAVAGYINRAGP